MENRPPTSCQTSATKRSYPVARRIHKKSKNGCRNCKERRVKVSKKSDDGVGHGLPQRRPTINAALVTLQDDPKANANSQCDEKRPLCGKCAIHYEYIERCEYDPESPVHGIEELEHLLQGNVNSSSNVPSTTLRPRGSERRLWSPESLSLSYLDALKQHPPSREPDIDLLMNAYFSTNHFNIFPYYPTRALNPVLEYFAPLIWQDSVLFHVTLLLSAFHLEKNLPAKDRLRFKRLLKECMSLLQGRINDASSASISDETLSAVAGLVAIEHQRANYRLVRTHMKGLKRIIEVRGGLEQIRKSNSTVANIVFCIFLATTESIPSSDLNIPVPRPEWFSRALPKETALTCISFSCHGVSHPYAELMLNIRLLAANYRTSNDCASPREYQDVLDFLCSTLQRLLVLPLPDPALTYDNCITAACRHALIVHVYAQWCGHPPDPSLLVSMAQHDLLAVLRPLMENSVSSRLLLWLLSVGGTGMFGQAERKWFVSHLVDVVEDLGINSWEGPGGMRANLKMVIWHDVQDEEQHRELWEEVRVMQEAAMEDF